MTIAELTVDAIADALHASELNCRRSGPVGEDWVDCPGREFEGHIEDAECVLAALEGRERPCMSLRQ